MARWISLFLSFSRSQYSIEPSEQASKSFHIHSLFTITNQEHRVSPTTLVQSSSTEDVVGELMGPRVIKSPRAHSHASGHAATVPRKRTKGQTQNPQPPERKERYRKANLAHHNSI